MKSQRKLIEPLVAKTITLRNRIVMAPMNRRRAKNGIPSEMAVTHYEQRTSAGLLITDNTAISSNGGAYMYTPGIYNEAQKQAWRKVADAVHAKGGKIVMQLVQAGRIGHSAIQNNETLVAPSAIAVKETIRIPDGTHQPMTVPIAIAKEDISLLINAFKQAAANAIEIGFDGVEIHAAHGFLIDEFINPHSNTRTDEYGGGIVNRTRFLLEVMQAVISAVGKERIGVRLSPFREIYDLKPYPEELETHQYIMDELQKLDILYVHFSNNVDSGSPTIPTTYLKDARNRFKNIIMIAGGYTTETAEEILQSGLVDLVAFGKLYISNPDLVERIENDFPLSDWDEETFYYGGPQGYIDYTEYDN